MNADRIRGRWQLVGLAALFFAPLLIAAWLYLGPVAWHPAGTTSHGELFEPPRPLPAVSLPRVDGGATGQQFLRGQWTLLYVGAGDCAERCRQALHDTRQIRLALGRHADRVQRVALFDEDCCAGGGLESEHPDLIIARLDGQAGERLLEAIPVPPGMRLLDAGRLYIVDPLGNLLLSYPARTEPMGILEDMKRLLRLSRIG